MTYNIHPLVEQDRISYEKVLEYELLAIPQWVPRWVTWTYSETFIKHKYHRYMSELEVISKELANE